MTAWLSYYAHGVIPDFEEAALNALFRAVLSFDEQTFSTAPEPDAQPQELPAPEQLAKFRKLKKKAVEIAALHPDEDKAVRLAGCSKRLHETKGGYLSSQERCNSRICPICRDIKAARFRSRLRTAFAVLGEKTPHAKYIFATFTARNVPLEELGRAVDELNSGWGRMIKKPAITKTMYGFAKVIQVKKGTDELANSHLHVIFALKSDYRKLMNSAGRTDFKSLWAEALGQDYAPEVNVKHIVDDASLARVTDYISASGIETEEEADLAWVTAADASLQNSRRFVSFGGLVRDVLQDIKDGKDSDWRGQHEIKRVWVWTEKTDRYS